MACAFHKETWSIRLPARWHLGLVSLQVINVFLAGFCRTVREDGERHGVGSEEECVSVEQGTFPFIPQDQF